MSELFSHDKLKANANDYIGNMRDWLGRIERDVADESGCIQAGLIMDLGDNFAKLSYVVGMINNLRFTQHDLTRKERK